MYFCILLARVFESESNVIIDEGHQMYHGSNIKLPTILYYIPTFVNYNQEIVQPKLVSHPDLVLPWFSSKSVCFFISDTYTHTKKKILSRIFMLPFSIKWKVWKRAAGTFCKISPFVFHWEKAVRMSEWWWNLHLKSILEMSLKSSRFEEEWGPRSKKKSQISYLVVQI